MKKTNCIYNEFFEKKINDLKTAGQYREFVNINRINGQYPLANVPSTNSNQKVVVWCSNDYLGMSQHVVVTTAMHRAIDRSGAGSGGSRNIGGSHQYYTLLEKTIADWHQKESALVYPTGYGSNDATLQCLLRVMPDCIVFSDEKNHASIINGIRSTSALKHVFKHNDIDDLERLLKQYPVEQKKIIVFESIYSMEGDVAPIRDIVNLAKKYNALTFLDEVHAIGMYGEHGAGMADALGVAKQVDIIQGTMAKGIGIIGGYISGSHLLIDIVRSFSSGFIFTTSLPPAVVAACHASIEHLKTSSKERKRLHSKTQLLREKLTEAGLTILPESTTHIIPVLVGDAVKCKAVAKSLLKDHNIYIQPINSPTVPIGTERLRINATPNHTEMHIIKLANALKFVFEQHGLLNSNKHLYTQSGGNQS